MNASDPNTIARYRAGYNECANEMTRYLMSVDGMDAQVRARLLARLASFCTPCGPVIKPTDNLQQIQQPQSITIPISQPSGPATSLSTNVAVPKHTEMIPGSLLHATQFQIVPGQLANGKIAAVLVPSQNPPLALVNSPHLIPVFNKAFPQGCSDQPQALRTDSELLWRPW